MSDMIDTDPFDECDDYVSMPYTDTVETWEQSRIRQLEQFIRDLRDLSRETSQLSVTAVERWCDNVLKDE